MNVFKKIMSAAIASATLLAGTAFPVSADYDPFDVNRDGRIGIADLTYLSKYLCGAYAIINYDRLDVNRSLTVDAADYELLNSKFLGVTKSCNYFSRKTGNVVSPPTVSGFTPSNSSSNSAGRTYMRCRYENGKPTALSDYTLTPLNQGSLPRAVMGEDERYASYGPENNGIVYLELSYDNVRIMGTGFIVGDHQIATNAHCVYNNGWRPLTINTYDSNGCITNNALHPVEAHIPKSYTPNTDATYDYALITVSDDLSDYVHFSLGTPYNVSASDYSNIPVYVTGCPGLIPGNTNSSDNINLSHRLYSAEGNVMDNAYSNFDVLWYNVDMTSGESGAPVYTITKIDSEYVYTAIAINAGEVKNGPNLGPMITNYHLQFYKNNPNASYSTN